MSLVKSLLENQPYYNLESIFRAFKRKEMKALRQLAENTKMPKRMLSPNAPAAKKTKYFAKFQYDWKSEFKWCQASSKGPVFSVLR
jgi:hypothetical protein